jgi:hypothetical protein
MTFDLKDLRPAGIGLAFQAQPCLRAERLARPAPPLHPRPS